MDHYTDMAAWNAEQAAFLAKIGQVETPAAKPVTKKEEE